MPPRPHWMGFLKLSLVSCPIALYPAISPAERISFRQVNRRTGHRLRQQLVDDVMLDLREETTISGRAWLGLSGPAKDGANLHAGVT